MDEEREEVGRIANATGLAGAEAPEPPSRLGPTGGIPCAASAPWDAGWWYSVIRDLHNQPYADYLSDKQRDGFGYPGWHGDNTANANLIAAAPDLYAALEALMDCWPEGTLPAGPVCVRASRALTKARGAGDCP